MERFVIIVNGWKSLTIITKRSILDVAAALDRQPVLKCVTSALHHWLKASQSDVCQMGGITQAFSLKVRYTKKTSLRNSYYKVFFWKKLFSNFKNVERNNLKFS